MLGMFPAVIVETHFPFIIPPLRIVLIFVASVFEDQETEAAAEGTAAHALCEHKLRKALKLRSKKPISQYDCDEMDDYTDGYVQFVLEQLAQAKLTCPDPQVLIEQRLDFSCYVPYGFGTGDCLIIASPRLHVIDFKYGLGVLVDAYRNPQMMLYALGALRIFDCLYNITEVSMSIYQPRRENVSTWTISVDELMDWAENTLRPKADLAYKGEGEYSPGSWCQFCKGRASIIMSQPSSVLSLPRPRMPGSYSNTGVPNIFLFVSTAC